MNTYQKALIEEHSNLIVRTQYLHNDVYGDNSENYNKVEFANRCIQLTSMKKYEECLRARMENAGIIFEAGQYFEKVAEAINHIDTTIPSIGSDYDKDKETISKEIDCGD